MMEDHHEMKHKKAHSKKAHAKRGRKSKHHEMM